MEPSYWTQFIRFVKESYTRRLKVSSGGIFMGFIAGNNLLFAGPMAHLVTAAWWVIKGVGTVVLAFFTSLATSYAAYLIDRLKEKKSPSPTEKVKRKNKAA